MKRCLAIALAAISLFSACDLLPTDETEKKDDDKTTATPTTALGKAFQLAVSLSSSQDIANPSDFTGTVYLDDTCELEAGTITNGAIALNLPEMATDKLFSAASCKEGMFFEPNTGKYRMPWLYAKKTNDTNVYRLSGNSGKESWVKFMYSDIDVKLTGSCPDGTLTDTFNCDLKDGWNWADWSWPDENNRVCKTVRYDTYTWTLTALVANSKSGIARTFDPLTLSMSSAVADPTSFSGKIYIDSACTVQAGTIEAGSIKLALPARSTSQLGKGANLTLTPSTANVDIVWVYVKSDIATDTKRYELRGTVSPSSMVKFIYSDSVAKLTGTFTDLKSIEYAYDCDLVEGWNVCVWSWDGDKRNCSKNSVETDLSAVTKWELTNW